MISVLIPTYNYNIVNLVKEIHKQVLKCNIAFEILVYDDGSKSYLNEQNKSINLIDNSTFKELDFNIGRSAIRNLLGKDAKYESLLFIDSGTFPQKKDFIKNYIKVINKGVITGGMTFLKSPPNKPYKLRWIYTKKREHYNNKSKSKSVIHSSNFLIQKKIFCINPFDKSIKKYGCEDVIFFDQLIKNGVNIHFIDNPVIHDADEDANTFINKTEYAIENLIKLIEEKKILKNRYEVSSLYYSLKKMQLDKIVSNVFKLFKPILKSNFNSSYPSILLYDFYRLGYFCLLKTKKQ